MPEINEYNQNQLTLNTKLQKSQMSVLSKSLLFCGLGFLIVCGLGYLINYLLLNPDKIGGYQFIDNVQTLNIVSSILLVIALVGSIFFMFGKPSFLKTSLMYILMIGIFSISFGFLFTANNISNVLFVFAIAGGTMLLSGFIGYLIKDKTAFSIMKILGFLFMFYFIFTLVFSLVSVFVFSNNDWLFLTLTIIMMVVIFLGNICSFYNIKKIDEFSSEMDPKSSLLISFQIGLNLLISLLSIIILLFRILRNFN